MIYCILILWYLLGFCRATQELQEDYAVVLQDSLESILRNSLFQGFWI